MSATKKHRIALISVDGDPAAEIGQEEAGGQMRQVGFALAAQGWQVDMFTRRSSREQAAIVQHEPLCRTIRLNAGPATFIGRYDLFDHMPEFIAEFKAFQQEQEFQYSVIRCYGCVSSWVGKELEKQQPSVEVEHICPCLAQLDTHLPTQIPTVQSRWDKKKLLSKLLMISEFIALSGIGWLDPTTGFIFSLAVLIWHLFKDKD